MILNLSASPGQASDDDLHAHPALSERQGGLSWALAQVATPRPDRTTKAVTGLRDISISDLSQGLAGSRQPPTVGRERVASSAIPGRLATSAQHRKAGRGGAALTPNGAPDGFGIARSPGMAAPPLFLKGGAACAAAEPAAPYPLAAAATSAAKSLSSLATPSPTSRRTKPLTSISEPTSLATAATALPTVVSGSTANSCFRRQTSA